MIDGATDAPTLPWHRSFAWFADGYFAALLGVLLHAARLLLTVLLSCCWSEAARRQARS
jgi:hypothetical protein